MSLKNKIWQIALKQNKTKVKKIEYSATNFVVRAIILCENLYKGGFSLNFFLAKYEMVNFERISRDKLLQIRLDVRESFSRESFYE